MMHIVLHYLLTFSMIFFYIFLLALANIDVLVAKLQYFRVCQNILINFYDRIKSKFFDLKLLQAKSGFTRNLAWIQVPLSYL